MILAPPLHPQLPRRGAIEPLEAPFSPGPKGRVLVSWKPIPLLGSMTEYRVSKPLVYHLSAKRFITCCEQD